MVNWIMACVTSTNYDVLVNGSPSSFFKAERGLRQGCPLSPLLFLLLIEGLSRMIISEKDAGTLHGINISKELAITHLLFVDDIILFGNCTKEEWEVLHKIFDIFCSATGMNINF